MTASLAAPRQSSGERRFAVIISTLATPQWGRISSCILHETPEDRVTQRMRQNPSSSNRKSTLLPMKPEAPVTRIWSSASQLRRSSPSCYGLNLVGILQRTAERLSLVTAVVARQQQQR